MISGRQTLSTIDRTLTDEHNRIAAIDVQIEQLNTRLVELQRAQSQDYKDLARVRIDLISEGELVSALDQAEQQVVAILGQRGDAAAELAQRIQASDAERKSLEAEREQQADRMDLAAETLDRAEAATQQRLDADPDYQAQRERTEEAERVAMHAADKASRSEKEKEAKGASYRGDPLFMYLWERHYGLRAYKASGLIRWLDGKVAHLIGFADARANYSRLEEIPKRLREHANALKAASQQAFEELKATDTAAQKQDGIPSLEAALAAEQERLDGIDQRIEDRVKAHQSLLDQKAAFASGGDDYSRKAVEFLASQFRREDLMDLRRDALTTPFPDDDLIVSRMLDQEGEQQKLSNAVRDLKKGIEQHHQRLTELEGLRMDFKRSRYDRSGSIFSDGALVSLMLSNFLNGMLDRHALWRLLQEQQRYRPRHTNPTFGSGGFGRGTVWGGSVGNPGGQADIVGSLGRGGFSGGGRSGGGGGGGFHTGGGF